MEYPTFSTTAFSPLKDANSAPPRGINEDLIAKAIVSVIQSARSRGQSLDEVMAELLADDALLDAKVRHLLSDIVAQAWNQLS
jgi:hypothetical protein